MGNEPVTGSDTDPPRERREVYYSGRVQGVGFRYLARGLAVRFGLVGFVQNLPDGRVLLVADGAVPAIDRLLQAIADEMSRFIRNTQVTALPAGNEFSEFDIRH